MNLHPPDLLLCLFRGVGREAAFSPGVREWILGAQSAGLTCLQRRFQVSLCKRFSMLFHTQLEL